MSGEAFLGKGWSFPPAFTAGGGDVELVSGADDVHESLRILFATQLGERVMREDYGCDLTGVLFEEIDQALINRITAMVKNGILDHEPRIVLEEMDVSERRETPGLLDIRLTYMIRGTNSRYNMVYPFYLQEAVSSA